MNDVSLARREFLRSLALAGGSLAALPLWAQEPAGLKEPVFRVAKGGQVATAAPVDSHPLDAALDMARGALQRSQRDVADYTATIIKRERINGVLGDYEYMEGKIRNRKKEGDKVVVPLSVYLKFIKPQAIRGREVVWVEGANDNKMRAHEGRETLSGRLLPTVWLKPDGPIAMKGNLHPITDIGIENLIDKLIERGTRERVHPECEVEFIKGAKLNGRFCTVLEVRHPIQKAHFEFFKAQIFIDDEMQIPIRYAAHHWPTDPNDKTGPVLEEYTYINVKLNQNLTDADFDSNNPNYAF